MTLVTRKSIVNTQAVFADIRRMLAQLLAYAATLPLLAVAASLFRELREEERALSTRLDQLAEEAPA